MKQSLHRLTAEGNTMIVSDHKLSLFFLGGGADSNYGVLTSDAQVTCGRQHS